MKKDPKIIRVGDTVKIINPELFVRCGYPLSRNDCVGMIEKQYESDIIDLIHCVYQGIDFIKRDADGKFPDSSFVLKNDVFSDKFDDSFRLSSVYREIVDRLSYAKLISLNFGGNERKIFIEKKEEFRNKVAKVVGIRFVKTGIYGAGYQFADDDWCQSGLSNEKTHKILKLNSLGENRSNKWTVYGQNISIEAIHTEKIFEIENKEV